MIHTVLNRSWFGHVDSALWLTPLIRSAKLNPFLQHSMLSAAYLQQDAFGNIVRDIPVAAFEHQLIASSLFRQAQPTIDQNNWIAIITFHIFTLTFEFSAQSTCPSISFTLVDTLKILRSAHTLELAASTYLKTTRFWQLISKHSVIERQEVDSHLQANLRTLSEAISEADMGLFQAVNIQDRIAILEHACEQVRIWAQLCNAQPKRWQHYTFWPAAVDPRFLQLVSEHDTIATLLFLHWCALMTRAPQPSVAKWAQRAAYHAIEIINQCGEWDELLAWPLAILSKPLNNDIFMARQIKDVDLAKSIVADQVAVTSESP